MTKPSSLMIGYFIPAYGGQVSAEVVGSVLVAYGWSCKNGHDFRYWWADVQPICRARNMALAKAMSLGCDILVMQDADTWAVGDHMTPLIDALDGETIAAAVAPVRLRDGSGVNVVRGGSVEIIKAGAALIAIDLRVMTIPAPFRWVIAPDGVTVEAGEDVSFSAGCVERGWRLVEAAVTTRHLAKVPLGV